MIFNLRKLLYTYWFLYLFVQDLPSDCSELYDKGEVNSGIYVIKPNHSEPFNVYCEMSSGESLQDYVFIHQWSVKLFSSMF